MTSEFTYCYKVTLRPFLNRVTRKLQLKSKDMLWSDFKVFVYPWKPEIKGNEQQKLCRGLFHSRWCNDSMSKVLFCFGIPQLQICERIHVISILATTFCSKTNTALIFQQIYRLFTVLNQSKSRIFLRFT